MNNLILNSCLLSIVLTANLYAASLSEPQKTKVAELAKTASETAANVNKFNALVEAMNKVPADHMHDAAVLYSKTAVAFTDEVLTQCTNTRLFGENEVDAIAEAGTIIFLKFQAIVDLQKKFIAGLAAVQTVNSAYAERSKKRKEADFCKIPKDTMMKKYATGPDGFVYCLFGLEAFNQ